MLLEHVFVTTREAAQTLTDARRLLQELGFAVEAVSETHLEARRGRDNPARAKQIDELPQQVRLEFDRGRVTLAASIHHNNKPGPLHQDLLTNLARTLELHLAHNYPSIEARQGWDQMTQRVALDGQKRRRHVRITLIILLLIILVPVALIIAFFVFGK